MKIISVALALALLGVYSSAIAQWQWVDKEGRVAERARARGSDFYSLLGAIGRDCVGALQFLPEGEAPASPDRLDARRIGDADRLQQLERPLRRRVQPVRKPAPTRARDLRGRATYAGARTRALLRFH